MKTLWVPYHFFVLEMDNRKNTTTLITLNSTENTDLLFERYKHFDGKFMLCMSGDSTGMIQPKRFVIFRRRECPGCSSIWYFRIRNSGLNHYLRSKPNNEQQITNFKRLIISRNENTAIFIFSKHIKHLYSSIYHFFL